MKLYHGTSASFLPKVLAKGLLPRGRRKGNWESAPSRNDCVYLTDAYAPYFCFAVDEKVANEGIVVEVDSDKLVPHRFLPDEDVLEQVLRGSDDVKGNAIERVAYYRKRLDLYRGNGQWKTSLQAMGTCCYLGAIPTKAITRIAVIPHSYHWFWDASISLMNYKFLGGSYRAQMARLFGDEPAPADAKGSFSDDRWKVPMAGHWVWQVKDGALQEPQRIIHADERPNMQALWEKLESERLAKEQATAS